MKQPEFDVAAAHTYFAAHCFNAAWNLMEKPSRTREEDRLMVALNQASIYHWQQRADCDDRRLSVGYWQASRIQALLANATEALHHAEICLDLSAKLEPFYLGYAHEALARAARLLGDAKAAEQHKAMATKLAEAVCDADDRLLLLKDVQSI